MPTTPDNMRVSELWRVVSFHQETGEHSPPCNESIRKAVSSLTLSMRRKNFAEMRCVGVFCLTEKQIRDIISISNIGNILKIDRKEVNAGERSKGL